MTNTSQSTADLKRDLKNDAAWLRDIAEGADVIPPHGDDIAVTMDLANQWLWPETRDNLLAIADALEAYAAREKALLALCDAAEINRVFGNESVALIPAREIRAILESKP